MVWKRSKKAVKVLLINSVCGIGSTGRICTDLARGFEAQGHEVRIAYGRDDTVAPEFEKYTMRIGTAFDRNIHALETRLFDLHGFGSRAATRRFLQWAEEYDPQLLWLHNIHGYYINIELLFAWIKKRPQMQVKWTLHDCWAFTGHCAYFTYVGCEQWKTGCKKCPQLRRYPKCYGVADVAKNYARKKKAFCGVPQMKLIVPSNWLKALVQQSFLEEYPVEVKYNTIDTSIFKPTPSDFRQRYGLEDKKIILGVASTWDKRKGLDDFVELAGMLDDKYVIVLVGLSKKQIRKKPKNIIGIQRTNSPYELAAIYTAADVFVNPSREESFGLTNFEAASCGIKSIVYENTACEELVYLNHGIVTPQSIKSIYQAIRNITS